MHPNSAVVVKDLRIQAGCGATLSTTLQGPQLGQTTPVRMSEAQWQNRFPCPPGKRQGSSRQDISGRCWHYEKEKIAL